MSLPCCLTPTFPFLFDFSLVQFEPLIPSIFCFPTPTLIIFFCLVNLCILIILCASINQRATLLIRINYVHCTYKYHMDCILKPQSICSGYKLILEISGEKRGAENTEKNKQIRKATEQRGFAHPKSVMPSLFFNVRSILTVLDESIHQHNK